MSAASVTAVIPTIGRPSLRRAVASVLRQTEKVLPLVVLDDPDGLAQVRRRLDGLDYELLLTEGRQGAAAARNLGVRLAQTQYVAFLDDDDEWLAEKTETQLADAGAETVVSSRAMLIGATSRIVPELLYRTDGRESLADYVLDRSTVRLRRHFMQSSTLLCPRQAALDVPWAEHLSRHQDWDWVIRLEAAGMSLVQRSEVLARVFQGSHYSISCSPDWRASRAWIESLDARVSKQAVGDFTASVVARGAFASGAWRQGARALLSGLHAGAHRAAVLVGMSGVMSRGGTGD